MCQHKEVGTWDSGFLRVHIRPWTVSRLLQYSSLIRSLVVEILNTYSSRWGGDLTEFFKKFPHLSGKWQFLEKEHHKPRWDTPQSLGWHGSVLLVASQCLSLHHALSNDCSYLKWKVTIFMAVFKNNTLTKHVFQWTSPTKPWFVRCQEPLCTDKKTLLAVRSLKRKLPLTKELFDIHTSQLKFKKFL